MYPILLMLLTKYLLHYPYEETLERSHMNAAIVVRLMIKNLIRYILKSWYRILKLFEDLKSAFNLILKKLISEFFSIFFHSM